MQLKSDSTSAPHMLPCMQLSSVQHSSMHCSSIAAAQHQHSSTGAAACYREAIVSPLTICTGTNVCGSSWHAMHWLPQTAPALHKLLHVMKQTTVLHSNTYHPYFLVLAMLVLCPLAPFGVDYLNQLLQLISPQVPGKQCQASRQAGR
jgi:hypothetical protein